MRSLAAPALRLVLAWERASRKGGGDTRLVGCGDTRLVGCGLCCCWFAVGAGGYAVGIAMELSRWWAIRRVGAGGGYGYGRQVGLGVFVVIVIVKCRTIEQPCKGRVFFFFCSLKVIIIKVEEFLGGGRAGGWCR